MQSASNKLVTSDDWSVILKADPTEAAQDALEAEYGARRFLPGMLIKTWCKENLKPREWTTTRPYYNRAKMITNHYSRDELRRPPMFFMFTNRAIANEVKDEFGHLFGFTEVNSNKMDGDNSVI